jgi:hypothetical protein
MKSSKVAAALAPFNSQIGGYSMSDGNFQNVTVFMPKHAWNNLQTVLSDQNNRKTKKQEAIIQRIKTTIVNYADRNQNIGISFSLDHLETVKSFLRDVCLNNDDDNWREWGESVIDVIDGAIDNAQEVNRVGEEAWNLWERAAFHLEQENTTEQHYRDAVSLLSLAIKKAKSPFPDAHSLLVNVAVQLQDFDLAAQHADITLKYFPNHFMAQFAKVIVAGQKIKLFNLRGFANQPDGFLTNILAVAAVVDTSHSQKVFTKEMQRLLRIFENLVSSRISCEDYVYMTSLILELANSLSSNHKMKNPFGHLQNEMYRAVGNVNIANLPYQYEEYRAEAQRLCLIAQGHVGF